VQRRTRGSGARIARAHIYDARAGGMSGAASEPDRGARVCENGLALVSEWICTRDATTAEWQRDSQEAFDGCFDRFMQAFEYEREMTPDQKTWATEMRRIKKDFLQQFVVEAMKVKVGAVLLRGITDYDHREEQDAVVFSRRLQNAKAIVENFMLLVNTSFMYDPEAFKFQNTFGVMHGLQFPGLWSRVLYKDPTPNHKYRNMLVGHRPAFYEKKQAGVFLAPYFECPKDQADGWALALYGVRMHINTMLLTFHDTILNEYDAHVNTVLNYWKNQPLLQEPPFFFGAAPANSVDAMTKPVEGGLSRYDIAETCMFLPKSLGRPCSVTTAKGYIFILTTAGEIWKVQTLSGLKTDTCESLVADWTKCIVEAPNRCVVKRLNFTKDSADFPALVCRMPDNTPRQDAPDWSKNWIAELSPTSLLADPRTASILYVLSHEQRKIYEITFNNEHMSIIRVHAGGKPNGRWGPRKQGDADENQDNVVFDGLMCGAFDADFNLYVCDNNWIRKITYASKDTRAKFTVSNIFHLQWPATCMTWSNSGFVVSEYVWTSQKKFKQVLCDVKWYGEEGAMRLEERTIADNGTSLAGSVLVDREDNIVYCAQTWLMNVNRDELQDGRLQHKRYKMHNCLLTGSELRQLTWFGGNILLCSLTFKGPLLLTFRKAGSEAAGGKREREAGGAEAEAAPAQRPRTEPATAQASMRALLEALGGLSV
jgi:hypothetical protein